MASYTKSLRPGFFSPLSFSTSESQYTEEDISEIKEAFNFFDSEETGGLNSKELKAAMSALNINVSNEEIRNIYRDFEKDIKEKISLQEFIQIVIPRLPDKNSKEYIKAMFQNIDSGNKGEITFEDLKNMAEDIGEDIDEEELREIMEEADSDGCGNIGFADFYKIMKKRNDLEESENDEEL